jgi:hypothetical protein
MGDAPNEHHFGNIAMGSRGGAVSARTRNSSVQIGTITQVTDHDRFSCMSSQNQGSLKATRSAIVWKRSGGGRTVEIPAAGRQCILSPLWFPFSSRCHRLLLLYPPTLHHIFPRLTCTIYRPTMQISRACPGSRCSGVSCCWFVAQKPQLLPFQASVNPISHPCAPLAWARFQKRLFPSRAIIGANWRSTVPA